MTTASGHISARPPLGSRAVGRPEAAVVDVSGADDGRCVRCDDVLRPDGNDRHFHR